MHRPRARVGACCRAPAAAVLVQAAAALAQVCQIRCFLFLQIKHVLEMHVGAARGRSGPKYLATDAKAQIAARVRSTPPPARPGRSPTTSFLLLCLHSNPPLGGFVYFASRQSASQKALGIIFWNYLLEKNSVRLHCKY